ncbi:hypothetical protein CXG81DRAFT_10792 [Caulochytrium protostelioides]|uniref:Protein MGR2 n=1 Tax=Caulochytrium protostelioides TaxID=1555241 RepID=A0A4P9XAP6_9FUNG|nr:hypothetical protein CXG81DRAFT_10792 [Caulochytrium protostelioides]|eukprot:RKP02405.1 hypothetical protein CXG81DRAFT_10792 [Caulochytrium protostelioides]
MRHDRWDKAKMGLLMGGATGASIGFIFGSLQALRFGPEGNKGYMGTIGSYMMQHGAFLGFLFSIASVLRADHDGPLMLAAGPAAATPLTPASGLFARRQRLPITLMSLPSRS